MEFKEHEPMEAVAARYIESFDDVVVLGLAFGDRLVWEVGEEARRLGQVFVKLLEFRLDRLELFGENARFLDRGGTFVGGRLTYRLRRAVVVRPQCFYSAQQGAVLGVEIDDPVETLDPSATGVRRPDGIEIVPNLPEIDHLHPERPRELSCGRPHPGPRSPWPSRSRPAPPRRGCAPR